MSLTLLTSLNLLMLLVSVSSGSQLSAFNVLALAFKCDGFLGFGGAFFKVDGESEDLESESFEAGVLVTVLGVDCADSGGVWGTVFRFGRAIGFFNIGGCLNPSLSIEALAFDVPDSFVASLP